MNGRIDELEELVKLQCTNGTWNYDNYLFGMANGLILALAVVKGEKPQFLVAPTQWLEDNEKDIKTELIEECRDYDDNRALLFARRHAMIQFPGEEPRSLDEALYHR